MFPGMYRPGTQKQGTATIQLPVRNKNVLTFYNYQPLLEYNLFYIAFSIHCFFIFKNKDMDFVSSRAIFKFLLDEYVRKLDTQINSQSTVSPKAIK